MPDPRAGAAQAVSAAMSSFEKGANVWYHHPQETWIPTVVLVGGSEEVTVKTEDGEVGAAPVEASPARARRPLPQPALGRRAALASRAAPRLFCSRV